MTAIGPDGPELAAPVQLCAAGELPQIIAVGSDDEDGDGTVAAPEERDAPAVGRELRKQDFGQPGESSRSLPWTSPPTFKLQVFRRFVCRSSRPLRDSSGRSSSPEPDVSETGAPPSARICQSVRLRPRADENRIQPSSVHCGAILLRAGRRSTGAAGRCRRRWRSRSRRSGQPPVGSRRPASHRARGRASRGSSSTSPARAPAGAGSHRRPLPARSPGRARRRPAIRQPTGLG